MLTDGDGRRLRLTQRRLASMDRPHVPSLETVLVADGWDGVVTVRPGIDAGITHSNVAEYAARANRHPNGIDARAAAPYRLVLLAQTRQSHIPFGPVPSPTAPRDTPPRLALLAPRAQLRT